MPKDEHVRYDEGADTRGPADPSRLKKRSTSEHDATTARGPAEAPRNVSPVSPHDAAAQRAEGRHGDENDEV